MHIYAREVICSTRLDWIHSKQQALYQFAFLSHGKEQSTLLLLSLRMCFRVVSGNPIPVILFGASGTPILRHPWSLLDFRPCIFNFSICECWSLLEAQKWLFWGWKSGLQVFFRPALLPSDRDQSVVQASAVQHISTSLELACISWEAVYICMALEAYVRENISLHKFSQSDKARQI